MPLHANYARFFKDFFSIVNKDAQTVPFLLNPIQEQYTKDATGRDIVLKARQQGFSSIITAKFAQDFMLKENITSMVIADEASNATGLLERVKFYLKSWEDKMQMKIPLKYNSKYELHNEYNNSKYIIGTAQSGAVGRSKTINNLHLSEVAFYPNITEIITGALQAVPPSGYAVIETTANGFNDFKAFWDRSVMGETGFKPLFYKASAFYSPDFLAMKEKELGDKFRQEYPETPEEAFITSGQTFFDKAAMEYYLESVKHVQTLS